ncbi:hypothetical protein IWZ03DRAFT_123951 [Phyllosticta citriasiana]|uniref:Uncharacterized protein n=1 Tax=Phyllosticta citriasiana TaxID=595635 RepID=A0ABR1K831_9PEZI
MNKKSKRYTFVLTRTCYLGQSFLGVAISPGNAGKIARISWDNHEYVMAEMRRWIKAKNFSKASTKHDCESLFALFNLGRQSNVYDEDTTYVLRNRVYRKLKGQLPFVEHFAVSKAQEDDKRAAASSSKTRPTPATPAAPLPSRMFRSFRHMVGATRSDDGEEDEEEGEEDKEEEDQQDEEEEDQQEDGEEDELRCFYATAKPRVTPGLAELEKENEKAGAAQDASHQALVDLYGLYQAAASHEKHTVATMEAFKQRSAQLRTDHAQRVSDKYDAYRKLRVGRWRARFGGGVSRGLRDLYAKPQHQNNF